MSKGLPPRVGDVLAEMGRSTGVAAPIETAVLWSRWNEIVGPDIAAHAEPTSLRDGVLRVRTDSPAWATEIGYLTDEIRKRANAMTGGTSVREVRVWTGPGPPKQRPAGAVDRVEEAVKRSARSAEEGDDPKAALGRAQAAWERRRGTRSGRRQNR